MEASPALERLQSFRPEVALVLGSGMGSVARRLDKLHSLPFAALPGLAPPSVNGHAGQLTLAEWAGRRVLVFEGRLHRYEGHSWECVTAPVRLAARLGVQVLLVTNAAGGIHESLRPGSLMALRDHIDCTRPNVSTRRDLYSPRLLDLLAQTAADLGQELHQGTYAAVTGPCYETPAEIRALRARGADAVGMSTAREIEAACAAGLECAAISCITNRAAGLSAGTIHHEEVLTTAAAVAERLGTLLETVLERSEVYAAFASSAAKSP